MLNNKPRVAVTDLGCTSMVSLCDPGGYWKQCNVICANTHTHTKSMSMYGIIYVHMPLYIVDIHSKEVCKWL